MVSFISGVLKELISSGENISEIIFILPSKRAGSFLLKELSALSENHIFAPKVYSIEEFTEVISETKTVDNTLSLFEFYNVYKKITPQQEQEDFETFTAWAQSLIHDFNEIDRYLIDYKSFFNYLADIQDLKHWSIQEPKTELINNYLSFWNSLPAFYEALKEELLSKNTGYQGLIYRKASENIPNYARENSSKHVFIGFNALNTAEQLIVQHLLENDCAEIYWDLDEVFVKDRQHDASLFINQYLKDWPVYREKQAKLNVNEYHKPKNIQVTGIPKNVGQAKYLGELLANLDEETLQETAVVLGEEDLLLPVLNSLPPNVQDLNITMGFPLKNAPIASLFDRLFQIHQNTASTYYYKDVISVINHPALHEILKQETEVFIEKIQSENTVNLSSEEIINSFSTEAKPLLKACFRKWDNSPKKALEAFQEIINQVKIHLKSSDNKLGLEFIYHFHVLCNKLDNLNEAYPHLKSIKSLYQFYKEIMSTQSLDFQGRPFKGLQLMGMLESRALDFKNVIICSVNEGVLPSGKSGSSFIPFDLKQTYKLPTYKEKDAVYTYHFYRLLQRAQNVHLLYNTETDGLNSGEKSRFLTQLEIEKQPAHQLTHAMVSPKVPAIKNDLREVKKTPEIMEKIKSLAAYGFSPSALTSYIRNPLDFYRQYVLGVRDSEEVEETVAYNTLGTVVHDSLENFYKPLENQILTEENIKTFKARIEEEITLQFKKSYMNGPVNQGKNLLIYEVAKRYLRNFLNLELNRLKTEEIKILKIEKTLKSEIRIEQLDFPIFMRGKVDRVESTNGTTRIIDYKTGKVTQDKIEIVDWADLTSDYDKYSKSFQVLAYTKMMQDQNSLELPVEAGIISFKNLKSGFLKFGKKDKPRTKNKETAINKEILEAFEIELKKLITEICDPEIPFTEKEI
ncbi:PD-(D/E)XK nuclease family protein [Salegentibacter salegens]|uniref:PD-(D/E)XK nuclease superfamily protein n=1 Tax=Salegentibacter salegens TaxID=143223 RepID=A0A1M7M8V2_9FLAO|nr:PD-(D/E)XK nuclease family protein [Salegentibacter salegens]PRX51536.1 PD-(D/E)XK nuclease superfamily protein [Salegentibacter salegens]SHM86709.1 PD-(D/E)XK nuclease superfamily protein [Salegentibacter salegens]